MTRKIISLLLALLVLLSLTGCGTKPQENVPDVPDGPVEPDPGPAPSEPQLSDDETRTEINGVEFALDKEAAYNGLAYTVSEGFNQVDQVMYVQYNYYLEDGSNLFFFRIFFYKNGTVAGAVTDLGLDGGIALEDGSTNGIGYKFYEKPRDDGGTIHFYFIEHEGNVYALNFICKGDISDFEKKAVASLRFG